MNWVRNYDDFAITDPWSSHLRGPITLRLPVLDYFSFTLTLRRIRGRLQALMSPYLLYTLASWTILTNLYLQLSRFRNLL